MSTPSTIHLNKAPLKNQPEVDSSPPPPEEPELTLDEDAIKPVGFVPLASSTEYALKRGTFGMWRIVLTSGKGAVPVMLSGQYTDVVAAEKDIENYINLQNAEAQKNNRG